jgi:hypothetical protein
MSFIAAALAKSKGKEVHPSPQDGLLPPLGSEMPAPPAVQEFPTDHPFEKKKSGPNLKLILALAGLLLVVGIVVGIKLMSRPAPPPPKPIAPVPAQKAPAQESPKPAAKPATEPAKVATTPAPEPVKPAVVTPVAPRPSEELLAMVHKFNVSAVMSGPNGRARIDGKTYEVGDAINADLTLTDIRDGQLFFKDTVGAVYAKRF